MLFLNMRGKIQPEAVSVRSELLLLKLWILKQKTDRFLALSPSVTHTQWTQGRNLLENLFIKNWEVFILLIMYSSNDYIRHSVQSITRVCLHRVLSETKTVPLCKWTFVNEKNISNWTLVFFFRFCLVYQSNYLNILKTRVYKWWRFHVLIPEISNQRVLLAKTRKRCLPNQKKCKK